MDRRNSLKAGATLLSGLVISQSVKGNTLPASGETDSFWSVVKNRRSVRKFKSDPVPDEHLMRIIDAARMAPTSGNQQPWKFIVVQSEKQIETFKKEVFSFMETYFNEKTDLEGEAWTEAFNSTKKSYMEGYLSAPAYIVVLTDQESKYPTYNNHDGPLAAGYLMLAAKALGYGTVYITDAIPNEVTQKAFNIPETYDRVCITPVGVPVEWPTKEKNALESFIVKETF